MWIILAHNLKTLTHCGPAFPIQNSLTSTQGIMTMKNPKKATYS